MYRVSPALALAGVLAVTVAGCSAAPRPAPARQKPPVSYYLALGDSLAVGVQPDAAGTSVETPSGYADKLYATLRRIPVLRDLVPRPPHLRAEGVTMVRLEPSPTQIACGVSLCYQALLLGPPPNEGRP